MLDKSGLIRTMIAEDATSLGRGDIPEHPQHEYGCR